MLNALLGRRQRNHEFLYWEFHERGFSQAARLGNWKAVRKSPDSPLELYDLKNDLGEQHDVAVKHPEVVKKIEDYMKTARTESELWRTKKGNKAGSVPRAVASEAPSTSRSRRPRSLPLAVL